MTSRLWWVRHGPTGAKGMLGWSDMAADLSDRAAIARLSDYLPADAVVVSSDLGRAVATGDALAGDRRRLAPDPALREMNFGAWEGRTHAEIEAESPAHIRAFWNQPGAIAPPGGESWDALCARVGPVATDLAGRWQDVVIVAHFGVILTQVQRALGITARAAFSHRIEPLSVTRIDRVAGRWQAGPINHLP